MIKLLNKIVDKLHCWIGGHLWTPWYPRSDGIHLHKFCTWCDASKEKLREHPVEPGLMRCDPK
jgi:hypothetical protein